jgi:bifunctional DNA-binding transcriptional regulator/antitoxin component of YhaV-PrlF toxin-antitoxin module
LVRLRVKTVKVGNSVRVALPSEILEAAKVRIGETLYIDYDADSKQIVLTKEGE